MSEPAIVVTPEQLRELASLLKPRRILRAQDVQRKIGVKHSKFYEILRDDSSFPAQQKCAVAGIKGWWEHEVDRWMRLRFHPSQD